MATKKNKRLKRFNPTKHYTVADAADKIGVSRQQVRRWLESGALHTAFKYAKGKSNKESFWAVFKYDVQEMKEKHKAAYGGEYHSEQFPHQRFITYCLVMRRFAYGPAKDMCNRYGLRFLSEKSCQNYVKYTCSKIKPYSPSISAAIRSKNYSIFNFEDDIWKMLFEILEIKELHEDFEAIPWRLFEQPVMKWHMDACVTRLANDEVMHFIEQRFKTQLTSDEVTMYRKYIFDQRVMTKDQIEMYLNIVSPDEASFKRGLLRGSMKAFKYKIGLSDDYDRMDSAVHRHIVLNDVFDMVAEDAEDPLTRYKATSALTGINKGALDNDKQIIEHEDRNVDVTGIEKTIQNISLKFQVEEKYDAIPMDQYDGKIMSGNVKKDNHGEEEKNVTDANAG